jgi:hypothetical protein
MGMSSLQTRMVPCRLPPATSTIAQGFLIEPTLAIAPPSSMTPALSDKARSFSYTLREHGPHCKIAAFRSICRASASTQSKDLYAGEGPLPGQKDLRPRFGQSLRSTCSSSCPLHHDSGFALWYSAVAKVCGTSSAIRWCIGRGFREQRAYRAFSGDCTFHGAQAGKGLRKGHCTGGI